MLKSKKAIETYLIILLVIGIIVSFFLFFILDGIYGTQNKNCFQIDYKITQICTNGNIIKFKIQNNAQKQLMISFNNYVNVKNIIKPKSTIDLNYRYKKDVVEVIPYVRNLGKINYCTGKKKSQNTKLVSKRC